MTSGVTFAAHLSVNMFDRNTIIGILLMVVLVIGYSIWQAPSEEERAAIKAQAVADSLANVQKENISTPPDTSSAGATLTTASEGDTTLADSAKLEMQKMLTASKFGILSLAAEGVEKEVVITNKKLRAVVSTKGGLFSSVTLVDGHLNYADSLPVQLWDDSLSKMVFKLKLKEKGLVTTDNFFFTPSAETVDATTNAQQLVMKLNTTDPGKFISIIYSIDPDSYAIKCSIQLTGLIDEIESGKDVMSYEWDAVGLVHEKGLSVERQHSSVFFREMEEDRDYLTENSNDEETTEGKVNWIAFKQNYFSAAVISETGFGEGTSLKSLPAPDSSHTMGYHLSGNLPLSAGSSPASDLTFFFGPNEFKILKGLEVEEMDRIIDYGPGIIGWVNKHMIRPLFVFFSGLTGNYGLIILIITIIIKLLLFPVTWKNFLSSAKMKVIKPELDEVNKKFADKPMEKQQAMMSLYRQTGVNPLAGCIPTLIQLPILYAMFRFFPASIEFRQQSFLWADDLAGFDAIVSWSKHIPLLSDYYGNHVSGFTILMCISTFFYTRMSMASTPAVTQPGMPNMKVIMNIFTFMMLFFFNNFASGLTLYYFTANVVSIGQMWVIKNYIIDEKAIREKIDNNKKKPAKKGGFAQRLEDMQKAQQKKLQDQKSKLNKK